MACRVAVGREEALAGLASDPSQLEGVAAVQCKGNFLFDPATHRDFLGEGLLSMCCVVGRLPLDILGEGPRSMCCVVGSVRLEGGSSPS